MYIHGSALSNFFLKQNSVKVMLCGSHGTNFILSFLLSFLLLLLLLKETQHGMAYMTSDGAHFAL